LQKENCKLKDSLKSVTQEINNLTVNNLTLQETLNQTQRKLKLHNENEALLGSRTEMIKTLEEEVERLRKLLAEQTQSAEAKENELTKQISQLNIKLLPLQEKEETLLIELNSNLLNSF